MNKEMQNYLNKRIINFSLEFEEGEQCDIQLCEKSYYFYIVKSCDSHFSDSSMRDVYATNDFEDACEWISENAENYDALMCCGYEIGGLK